MLRGLLKSEDVERLRLGVEKNLRTPSWRAVVASEPDDPGRFFEDFVLWKEIEEFEHVARHSPIAAVASDLMQSKSVRLHHDHVLVKEPGTKAKTPFHQDAPYYNVRNCESSPYLATTTTTCPRFMLMDTYSTDRRISKY